MFGWTMTNNYILRAHEFFANRVDVLKEQVKKLKQTLPPEEFVQHEVVKLAARVRNATIEVIPQDPNRPEYLLSGDLRKYRRYKQGLQRYRIIFCFSNKPSVIIYLYMNDEKHLRKDGSKNDPYHEFKILINKGKVSHSPHDPAIQEWIQEYK